MKISAEMKLKFMQRKKTVVLLIVLAILLAILLAVSVILCYFFIPRSLTKIVPMKGINSIYYEYGNSDTIPLTEQNQQELRDSLSKMKYRPKIGSQEKAVPYNWLCVSYDDGTVIKIMGQRVVEKKRNGTSNVYYLYLIGNGNLFRFFPDIDNEIAENNGAKAQRQDIGKGNIEITVHIATRNNREPAFF